MAGGRNKMVAAKAYDMFNAELQPHGFKINSPETIWDVSKNEVSLWVKKMGGQAVVKVPYSNAGQGVYTIVTENELDAFMELEFLKMTTLLIHFALISPNKVVILNLSDYLQ